MKKLFLLYIFTGFIATNLFASERQLGIADPINYIKISQDFLYAAKTGTNTISYIDSLQNVNENVLAAALNTDQKRLAFWLNIYNGFTQAILKKNPEQYKTRTSFFSSRQIIIASNQLSLDAIEHGILRRSKIKWSLGYLGKLFPSNFEKKFRVEKLDYRIHFALNCGAKSCPPIAFYDPAAIDKQLTMATKVYLNGACEYNQTKNEVYVPKLMSWFSNDFGGKKNMLKILKQNKIIPQASNPEIHFKSYDWSLFLDNYK